MSILTMAAVYLRYRLTHKWYVFKACAKHGLWWRGLIHDWSKFLPGEFIPNMRHYCAWLNRLGAVEPGKDIGESDQAHAAAYERAWFTHQKRNDHHWQWWICITSRGTHIAMAMSSAARREMICDWYGTGMAQGDPDIRGWYERNKEGMLLHPETRAWVEENL